MAGWHGSHDQPAHRDALTGYDLDDLASHPPPSATTQAAWNHEEWAAVERGERSWIEVVRVGMRDQHDVNRIEIPRVGQGTVAHEWSEA
jgi:hypothetical protein